MNLNLILALIILIFGISMPFVYNYIRNKHLKKIRNYFGDTLKRTGHPLIRLYHNKKPYLLLLDTGATHNVIDTNVIKELDKKFVRKDSIALQGINSNDTEVLETYRIRFDDKNNSFTDDFIAMDLYDAFSDAENEIGEPVIGILGVGFLSKYALTLDFKQNTVK
jgi:hypothetical protein